MEILKIDYYHIIKCYVDSGMKISKATFRIYHFKENSKDAIKYNKENERLYQKIVNIIKYKEWYFIDELRSLSDD